MRNVNRCDLLIIGGGAAGLVAAITAKKLDPTLRVMIAERGDRVAKKLITTGNGRCNLTNADLSDIHFHSSSPSFSKTARDAFAFNDTVNFFREIGVEVVTDGSGRAYPASFQASSVVDALRFAADELGVQIFCDQTVQSLKEHSGGFVAQTDDQDYFARAVILATGGLAGGARLGCDNTGYSLAEAFGHKIVTPLPAITQIKTDTSVIRRFKGIKTDAFVTARCSGRVLRQEFGELLFCDYGISGPPVFQLSGSVSGRKNCEILIDFMPDYTDLELLDKLVSRRNTLAARDASEFLTGFMNKRIGQYFAKEHCGYATLCRDIADKSLKNMVHHIKSFTLSVLGTSDFRDAQVTIGGVDVRDIGSNDMMSKKADGLFFAGEILDVHGDCGGYNLQWAFASASAAAKAAVKRCKI